eukprot:6327804-Amphidinium_carterae.1
MSCEARVSTDEMTRESLSKNCSAGTSCLKSEGVMPRRCSLSKACSQTQLKLSGRTNYRTSFDKQNSTSYHAFISASNIEAQYECSSETLSCVPLRRGNMPCTHIVKVLFASAVTGYASVMFENHAHLLNSKMNKPPPHKRPPKKTTEYKNRQSNS